MNNFTSEKVVGHNLPAEIYDNDAYPLAGIGSWKVDFETNRRYWSKEVFEIFELTKDQDTSTDAVISFFVAEDRKLLMEKLMLLRNEGFPYDLQLQMITHKGNKKWVRSAGKAERNANNELVAIHGIFQDIQQFKTTESQLQDSLHVADNQNKQLAEFAKGITNSLSTHSSNFNTLLFSLMQSNTDESQEIILQQLQKVAATLEKNIVHLKSQLASQQAVHNHRTRIRFEDMLDRVIQLLSLVIAETGTIIEADFSQADELNYLPAYLESIFLNLVSNAIKFRHADRTPHVHIRTYVSGRKIILEVQDNGIGIDLTDSANDVFALYQSSLNPPEAKGIGLYLVRNQVKAMGGSISVKSKLDEGSTFTVEL